jgi:Flp pilus assembly protein TadG
MRRLRLSHGVHSASSFRNDESGAAMVEFAIAATVFIMILLGILEFGYAAWAKNSVAADAREGARYAVVHGGQSGRVADSAMVANFVKSKTSLGNSIVVIPTWSDPTQKMPGSRIAVKVKNAVPRRGPFLPARTDSSMSTMVILF